MLGSLTYEYVMAEPPVKSTDRTLTGFVQARYMKIEQDATIITSDESPQSLPYFKKLIFVGLIRLIIQNGLTRPSLTVALKINRVTTNEVNILMTTPAESVMA